MQDLLAWLDTLPAQKPADELTSLHHRLTSFRGSITTNDERAIVLDRFFTRSMAVAEAAMPKLSCTTVPIPRKTRQLVRLLQDLTHSLATDFIVLFNALEARAGADSLPQKALALRCSLILLAQHLTVSDLVAAPSGTGIWQLLHQTYDKVRQLGLEGQSTASDTHTIRQIYCSAILLGCAQPASFTSKEVGFVVANLDRFARQVEWVDGTTTEAPEEFWIDPTRDSPAVACSRKPAPTDTLVYYFSCARIAASLRKQLTAIESGRPAEELNAPDFAKTNAGRGVLRRLIANWGEPGKRRFTRRRQHDRAILCAGLDSLWRLFQDKTTENIETSSWMITNQSPDGYAIMHLSGATENVTVGDICAVRADSEDEWQICIVRWALSENQEHLELGLQILATNAVPAFLAQPNKTHINADSGHASVLILPETPPLRANEMLVTTSGTIECQATHLILVIEQENVGIREVINTALHEQNSRIEVFAIESDEPND